MSRKRDQAAEAAQADRAHGTLLVEENPFDRRVYLRLGGWSVAATGAVVLAMLANQSSLKLRRDEMAAADLALQARQVQMLSQQTLSDSKRLASAVETLNSDRDRLYSRVTTLEQGLDSVTGSIGRQAAAATRPTPPIAEPPPPAAPVATAPPSEPQKPTAATPLMASKSLMAPPDAAAGKFDAPSAPPVVASASASVSATEPAAMPVPHTEFGIDLGIAPSIDGLRALWRQISAAHPALASLQPLIVVKERPGAAGMQLRLVAGPLRDASSAAQICAALPAGRLCEPATYDGQRLALTGDGSITPPAPKPVRRKPVPKPVRPAEQPAPPAEPSARTSLLRG